MADTLTDVVQHLTDGALAQGYITAAQAQEANAAAARGERPDLDLSAAPAPVREAADAVLNQADAQARADEHRADQAADLSDRWADHHEDLEAARRDATGLKHDLDGADVQVGAAEAGVAKVQDLVDHAPRLADALVNDTDLETYQALAPAVEERARPLLNEAVGHMAEARESLIEIGPHLADSLDNAVALETTNTQLWNEQDQQKAADTQAAQTWSVLEGQADDVYQTATDAAAHADDGGHDAHAAQLLHEPAHAAPEVHADAASVL